MRPAFSSLAQTAFFALCLLMVLLSPLVIGRWLMPPREEVRRTLPWQFGAPHWIYDEQGDIDVVLIGSSRFYSSINTPNLQAKLSEKLGRPAVVRTISWPFSGFDVLFFMTRDLLERRHVKILVFCDEKARLGTRNPLTRYLYRWNEDNGLLAGLPASEYGLYYFASIMGMPVNFAGWIRSPMADWAVPILVKRGGNRDDSPDPTVWMNKLPANPQLFQRPNGFDMMINGQTFKTFVPVLGPDSGNFLVYSEATKANFQFSSNNLADWESVFLRHFITSLRKNGVQPVMLYLPVIEEGHLTVIPERADWRELCGNDLILAGIPPSNFFAHFSDTEIAELYGDTVHFNQNGYNYFTKCATPGLVDTLARALTEPKGTNGVSIVLNGRP